ncbi:hypothetical protein E2C01_018603 [Portunus trituberculatus]|uniref:Uncharacterized protein n=1 Tax=Portunus trituberculatus TaxID=210409 RepID=A0A5B7DWW1_PORTR|nr:hypothetical protein [Portunus trituberculatus]
MSRYLPLKKETSRRKSEIQKQEGLEFQSLPVKGRIPDSRRRMVIPWALHLQELAQDLQGMVQKGRKGAVSETDK